MTDAAPANCRLMVATPIYDGAQGTYVRAALGLALAAQAEGVPVRFEFILHEAQIHRARSLLADLFVQSDCSHLLFVDADIDFAAADIFSMIEAMADGPTAPFSGPRCRAARSTGRRSRALRSADWERTMRPILPDMPVISH